jgi:hypothetical protein
LYEKFLQPNQQNEVKVKQEWNRDSLRHYLQKLIGKISSKTYEDLHETSKSIFDIGFDSLHAVQFRNQLCSIFPSIPMNFVYEYSSIDSMVDQLLSQNDQVDSKHYILTETLVNRYIHRMENDTFAANPLEKKNEGRVFLVTGANGSLGSFIVLDLLKQETVSKVFCLFRGQNKNRIIKEFEQRHQSTQIFNENNNRLILLPNMKLSDEFLGQDMDTYNQLCHEVTDIVHSAYRMDVSLRQNLSI